MSAQLMTAKTEVEREEAVAKLYVLLQQRTMWLSRLPNAGTDGLAGILNIDMPELIKFMANMILRTDKPCSDQARLLT